MDKNKDTLIDKQENLRYAASKIVTPIIWVIFITSNPVQAQIQPDASLGNESSRVTSGVQVKTLSADLIEGGATRGSSLFHSFSEFNINDGQRVYFVNPAGVDNIFSRVTGSNVSHILGTLGVNGAANLYLLNPKGIIFGKDAKLDIQGAFFATTANSFTFPDGSEFSATNPQMPMLTMSVPVGVQFGSQPGDIRSRGNLTIQNDLTLKGGNLDLQGEVRSGANVTLTATKNINFDLISTTPNSGNAGSVDIKAKEDIIGNLISAASFKSKSNNGSSGNISLISQQGKVVIRGRIYKKTNTIDDNDRYFALGAFVDSYSLDTNYKAGNITIQASKDINIGSNLKNPESGAINASVLTKNENANAGNSGTIKLTSTNGNIIVNGGIFTNSTVDQGNGKSGNSGDILLTAKQGEIKVIPNDTGTIITRSIATAKTGNAGSIKIDGKKITIQGRKNQSSEDITTQSNQTGNGGNIIFTSLMPLELNDITIGTDAKDGQGGDVKINAPSITLNNATISAKTSGTGKPGSISLTAYEDVFLNNNSQIISDAENDKYEDFKIKISSQTGSIYMNGATVKAYNGGSGFAGIIYINAPDSIQIINNSKINADGDGGIISIGNNSSDGNNSSAIPQTVEINNNSSLTTSYETQSSVSMENNGYTRAGVININARDKISILNQSKLLSQGNDGNILIGDSATNKIEINNNSNIDTTNILGSFLGNGKAGFISINARDKISILNRSKLSSQGNDGNIFIGNYETKKVEINNNANIDTTNFSDSFFRGGNAGNININASEKILVTNYSKIDSSTSGQGNAGQITINAQSGSVFVQKGEIASRVAEMGNGNGGNVDIYTGFLFLGDQSVVTASTRGQGNAGDVTINATQKVELQQKGRISSAVRETGKGSAGSIKITAPTISLSSRAKIEVDSQNTDKDSSAGNMTLSTNFLKLNNASITAQNQSGNGGDINITTQNLLLRHNSEISSKAGSEKTGGNGGKITINAKNGFVIAVPSEDSDIIANAFGGNGGIISIKASRVFGLETRERLNKDQLEGIRNNNSSEISASSDIGANGQVAIQTLSVDPSQGLVQLPTDLVDLTGLIAQGCGSNNNNNVAKGQSAFVVTGRGGLPPNPDDVLSAGTPPMDWVTRDTNIYSNNSEATQITQKHDIDSSPLVEAVGMVRNGEGDIVLTAQPVTARGFQSGLPSLVCNIAQREGK